MKFGPVPLPLAAGKILGHNIAGPDGRRLLKKGKPLTDDNLRALAAIGRETVYVAELEPDDVAENDAARRVGTAMAGRNLRSVGPSAGRLNLLATGLGILRVDVEWLAQINDCEGLTVATLMTNTPVQPRQIVATIKVIPYALPEATVHHAEMIACENDHPLISVDMLTAHAVSMIFSGSPSLREKLNAGFAPLRSRIEALGSRIAHTAYISLDDEQGETMLAEVLCNHYHAGAKLILLAGETAIMDRSDIVPRALERAGGRVEVVGVPVDPGNLFMLGYLHGVPVLGAPGCARSKKTNVIDWVLPRLLAGDRLVRSDFISLGHGGLLEDTRQRPMPRGKVGGTQVDKYTSK
ncbi:MAG TPA: molybdopterin-binding protein [Anaerolineales bacterium]|nr:molybdopterin-binding protein [Anaerolineales bacterium]